MVMPRGPNERALGTMLAARGVETRAPGELAALITVARTLARELDASEAPTAAMASAYLSALRQLLERTEREESEGEQLAETIRRLRSV